MTKELIQEYTLKITQSSRTEIIVVLYDLAINYINDAVSVHSKSHEDFRSECLKANKVIADLMGALDFSYELAAPLYRVYEYISKEISMSVIKNDTKELITVKEYLKSLKDSFEKIAETDNSGPAMDNTQTVYAGLTYGKGTLNENLVASNPNRGFSV